MILQLGYTHIKSKANIRKEAEDHAIKFRAAELRSYDQTLAEESQPELQHLQSKTSTKKFESSSHMITTKPGLQLVDASTGIIFKVRPTISTKTTATASSKKLATVATTPNGSKVTPVVTNRVAPKTPSRLTTNPSPKPSPHKTPPRSVAKTTPTHSPRTSVSGTKITETATQKYKSGIKPNASPAAQTNFNSTPSGLSAPRKPPVPKAVTTPSRPSAPSRSNTKIAQQQYTVSEDKAFDTFGMNREEQIDMVRKTKLKAKIFDCFIRNIVYMRAEVSEKKEVLNILQSKRIIDAWREQSITNSLMEYEFTELADEFFRVGC